MIHFDHFFITSAMDGRLALRPVNRPCWPAMTGF
jgi:hypothetical protein